MTANRSLPFVSVIIPVFKGWTQLENCLKALQRQSYPPDRFEIIVINNEPKMRPSQGFSPTENINLIHEPKPGSYAARNAGVRTAKGEILAFTDSDCLPEKDWIQTAVAIFSKHPDLARIGGKIELNFGDSKKPAATELYEKVFAFQQQAKVEEEGSAITANMFSKAIVFTVAGFFNGNLKSGGDLEWGRRAQKAGFSIIYAPNVSVIHSARSSWGQLARKVARLRGGRWQLKKESISKTNFGNEPAHSSQFRIHFVEMVSVFTTPHLETFGQRIRVAIVVIFLYLVKLAEQIRLLLGGTPRRE